MQSSGKKMNWKYRNVDWDLKENFMIINQNTLIKHDVWIYLESWLLPLETISRCIWNDGHSI